MLQKSVGLTMPKKLQKLGEVPGQWLQCVKTFESEKSFPKEHKTLLLTIFNSSIKPTPKQSPGIDSIYSAE